jgi:amino acid transporter
MNRGTNANTTPQLHRVIGTFDLVLLNIAAIVSLRWLPVAARIGPSSLTLWVLGLITFLVPSGLTVLELSSRCPGEGGVYLWAKAAFGERHAFIAGWSYWIANLVYFPSLLLFMAVAFLYIHGGSWLGLADQPLYNGVFCITVLWCVILLNILGLERAKWLQNVGSIAIASVGALILCGGALASYRFGPATPIVRAALVPDLGSMATLVSFATIALAYQGLELGPILGGEIKDPHRSIARALLIACVAVSALYIAGTAALFLALPAQSINAVSGIPQALAAVAARDGIPSFGSVAAALLTLAEFGVLGAWVGGTARLPFLFGLYRYLPKALGAVHPTYGSPYVALITQGVLATVILLTAISGSAVREAYFVLIDMVLILSLLPILYMFAALPILRLRAPKNDAGVRLIPGGPIVCCIVSGSGFAVTLTAILIGMIPPIDSADRGIFALKVVGGCALLLGAGLIFYFHGRRKAGEPINET